VRRLARISRIEIGAQPEGANGRGAHMVLRGGSDVFVALADLIDIDKERTRLQTEIERAETQLRAAEMKLLNEQFVARAPAQVVQHESSKADSLRDQLLRLREKLAALE
jgi:valyl-tRNA synthetase